MSWKKFKAALAHAFDYDDGSDEVTEEEIALMDRVADFVVRRRLVAPAILMLESVTPFNFIGSSAMTFFRPLFGIIFSTTEYEKIEKLLERRCSIGLMVERIELRDQEAAEQRKQARRKGSADNADPSDPSPSADN